MFRGYFSPLFGCPDEIPGDISSKGSFVVLKFAKVFEEEEPALLNKVETQMSQAEWKLYWPLVGLLSSRTQRPRIHQSLKY